MDGSSASGGNQSPAHELHLSAAFFTDNDGNMLAGRDVVTGLELGQVFFNAVHGLAVNPRLGVVPSAASRGTTISWARTSGSGRLSDSSGLSSLSQRMSRLGYCNECSRFQIFQPRGRQNQPVAIFSPRHLFKPNPTFPHRVREKSIQFC